MYGNNQDYNNGNPLFNNQKNNGFNSQGANNSNNIYQNNNLFGQQQNPGYVATNFDNIQNNTSFSNMPTMNDNDIPPELGEIKNLSDATIASAPTMDVLGPMNIMPDVLPQQKDPLDAYENGNLNIENPSFNQGQVPNNNISIPSGIPNNIPNQFNNNNQSYNNFMNNNVNNGFNNNINNGFNNEINNTFNNSGYSNTNSMPQPNLYNNQNLNELNLNNNVSSSNGFGFENNSYQPINLANENIQNINSSITNQDYNVEAPKIDNEQDYNVEIPNEENKIEEPTSSIAEPELSKEQEDTKNNDTEQQNNDESNLSDLGLDESYNEPDMLEIMDIDEENNEEGNDEGEAITHESGSVSENVEKIKKLIEELKASGADIELEEFDFETMYQLIVKLNK